MWTLWIICHSRLYGKTRLGGHFSNKELYTLYFFRRIVQIFGSLKKVNLWSDCKLCVGFKQVWRTLGEWAGINYSLSDFVFTLTISSFKKVYFFAITKWVKTGLMTVATPAFCRMFGPLLMITHALVWRDWENSRIREGSVRLLIVLGARVLRDLTPHQGNCFLDPEEPMAGRVWDIQAGGVGNLWEHFL